MLTPSEKLYRKVDKLLKKAGLHFCRVRGVGWKVYDSGIDYSWIEYEHSSSRCAIRLRVDKLRDNAENFVKVLEFHNMIIEE